MSAEPSTTGVGPGAALGDASAPLTVADDEGVPRLVPASSARITTRPISAPRNRVPPRARGLEDQTRCMTRDDTVERRRRQTAPLPLHPLGQGYPQQAE